MFCFISCPRPQGVGGMAGVDGVGSRGNGAYRGLFDAEINKCLFYDAGSVVSVNCDIESFLFATVDNSFDGKLVDAIFL